MRTYIDVIFNPEMNPAEFAREMIGINMQMLFGPHDFVIVWDSYDEFQLQFKSVLQILKKFQLNFRLLTYEDSKDDLPFMNVALSG